MEKTSQPTVNGFFNDDKSVYINCSVGKSSPNRRGHVKRIFPVWSDKAGWQKVAEVEFRDVTLYIGITF